MGTADPFAVPQQRTLQDVLADEKAGRKSTKRAVAEMKRRWPKADAQTAAQSRALADRITAGDKDAPAPAYKSHEEIYHERIARIPQTDMSKAVQQDLFPILQAAE